MKKILFLTLLLLSTYSKVSTATILPSCNTNSVSLDTITTLGDNTNLLPNSYSASACVGTFPGHDDWTGEVYPDPNIGHLNDGFLNGEGLFFDGMEFITPEDLQDLDGDGEATDPGWIHLGTATRDIGWFTKASSLGDDDNIEYDTAGPSDSSSITLDISELLTLTFDCNSRSSCRDGSWGLATKPSVIADAQSLLGPSTFDHLALSISTATRFAVYDFNFKDIFAQESNPLLNFNTPYVLGGTFSTADFPGWFNDESAFHIGVWARDPSEVPEPNIVMLFAFTFLCFAFKKAKK